MAEHGQWQRLGHETELRLDLASVDGREGGRAAESRSELAAELRLGLELGS